MYGNRKALLAPLSTFTNLPFRLLCQEFGADGTMVPLISAKAVCIRKKPIRELDVRKFMEFTYSCERIAGHLDPHPEENFVGVQLFGSSSFDIKTAANIIIRKYDFIKYIDINCACPVPKITRCGAGAALLHTPKTVVDMIMAAKDLGLPITIKIRKLKNKEQTLNFCTQCAAAGVDSIHIHGRSAAQGYSGEADWELIHFISDNLVVPVVGSGNINSVEQGRQYLDKYACAAFMIGRAAMGNPEIFSGISTVTKEQKTKIFERYHSICQEYDCLYFTDLKSKAIQFFTGFNGSVSIRRYIGASKNIDELMKIVK